MALGGAVLKSLQTLIYALAFGCSAVILALYSYFLAAQSNAAQPIPTWQKAVEGLSGAAVLYTIFAVLLTCFLGGKVFFAFLAIVLDVLFCGAFIALAILTRSGAKSCSGDVDTPIGSGLAGVADDTTTIGPNGNTVTYNVSLRTACRMQSACFAVAIIGAFLFLIAAVLQIWLGRHHKKEKRYGPSPANGYTAGSPKGSWFARRRRGAKTTHQAYNKDAESGVAAGGLAVPATHAHHNRASHDTAFTGTTAGDMNGTYTGNKYETGHHVPTTGGFATTGTAVNPYGYDGATTTTTTHHAHPTTATNY